MMLFKRRWVWPLGVSALDVSLWFHVKETPSGQKIVDVYKTNKNVLKYQLYPNASKKNRRLLVVIYIWMICLELNWFFYDPSWMLHLSEFVWTLLSWVWVVFTNFLLIPPLHFSLYPFSVFASSPINNAFFVTTQLYRLN